MSQSAPTDAGPSMVADRALLVGDYVEDASTQPMPVLPEKPRARNLPASTERDTWTEVLRRQLDVRDDGNLAPRQPQGRLVVHFGEQDCVEGTEARIDDPDVLLVVRPGKDEEKVVEMVPWDSIRYVSLLRATASS